MSNTYGDINYNLNSLVEILDNEIKSNAILDLPVDFYQNTSTYINNLQIATTIGLEKVISERYVSLLKKCILCILKIRLKKMVTLNIDEIYSHLTNEEKILLIKRNKFDIVFSEITDSIINGHTSFVESLVNLFIQKNIIVRFLKPIDAFIGVNLNKYGPFEKEDMTVLPYDNARSLESNGHVEMIYLPESL